MRFIFETEDDTSKVVAKLGAVFLELCLNPCNKHSGPTKRGGNNKLAALMICSEHVITDRYEDRHVPVRIGNTIYWNRKDIELITVNDLRSSIEDHLAIDALTYQAFDDLLNQPTYEQIEFAAMGLPIEEILSGQLNEFSNLSRQEKLISLTISGLILLNFFNAFFLNVGSVTIREVTHFENFINSLPEEEIEMKFFCMRTIGMNMALRYNLTENNAWGSVMSQVLEVFDNADQS